MKSFLVIGMGHFGHHLCRSLIKAGCEVMIVDKHEANIEDMLEYVVSARIGDCTKRAVIESFDVPSFDACFVCIGENFQSSLEITDLLKECGAKKIIAKANRDNQEKFLLRNGADMVIYPEKHMAERLAVSESNEHIFDFIDLGDGCVIYEIDMKEKWVGKSVRELNFRAQYNVSVLAVKKNDRILPIIDGDLKFTADEHLLVMGIEADLKKLTRAKG